MNGQETLLLMALTRVPSLSLASLRILVEGLGSASAIYEHRYQLSDLLPAAPRHTLAALADMDRHLPRAEQELAFCQAQGIQCLGFGDEGYPERLRSCPDAPVLLYYRGTASLNARRVVSMVGTRQVTPYGRELCQSFVGDLHRLCPDALVVSGLAYGVDVCSHRAALGEGMATVGVLAHGLDQIYPRLHRETAIQMASQGGLLTEYPSGTAIDKRNFVQRNRIVAGMADAVVVVESAARGGSLITADIALSYNRQVWAFPGRTSDPYSSGCNRLIFNNAASLLTCADDFCQAMGWSADAQRRKALSEGVQQELFAEYSPQEQRILEALSGSDGKQLNVLSVETDIPTGDLSGLLFSLEMKGAVQALAGSKYRLRA